MALPVTIALKQGDTTPPLRLRMIDAQSAAIPLTGATVTFFMVQKSNKQVKVQRVMTNDETANGIGAVVMPWQPADVDTKGVYLAECQIIFGDGTEITCPNDSYITITIVKELG